MKKVIKEYQISRTLLKEYYTSSLINSEDLLLEADLLNQNKYFARCYFLSCSVIEECGKALHAFNGLGRNLNDSAVQSTLKRNFENHHSKNLMALISLFQVMDISKVNLDFIWNTSNSLQEGREKSLYVDILKDGTITIPSKVVSSKNSNDTLKLAKHIFKVTKDYINSKSPREYSTYEDKFFSIPVNRLIKMYNEENFWDFIIDQISTNSKPDYIKFTMQYWDKYFNKNKKYIKK